MFELTEREIDCASLRKEMESAAAGAFVCFEGRVRDSNEGKSVLSLSYEAFEALAIKEGKLVLEEASRLYPLISVRALHRIGALKTGEVAVWVGVLSCHRGEAFESCRYVIDQIKSRVPIWKKEFYADGSSVWVNCAECHAHAVRAGGGDV